MNDAERIYRLEMVLGTLITWIAQSSTSPISGREAGELLKMLQSSLDKKS